jgi:hypothetical protein
MTNMIHSILNLALFIGLFFVCNKTGKLAVAIRIMIVIASLLFILNMSVFILGVFYE